MYKLASQEIDFHDRASFLEALAETQEIPDFVKKASAVERGDIPLDSFALVAVTEDGTFPKFALHNKAYVWISSRLFGKTAARLPERGAQIAATKIKEACESWGFDVPGDVLRYADPIDPVTSNFLELSKQAEEKCQSALDYSKYRVGYRGEPPKAVLSEKIQELLDKDDSHMPDPEHVGEELAGQIYSWAMSDGYTLPSPESVARAVSSKLPEGVPDKGKVRSALVEKMKTIGEHEKVKRASELVRTHSKAVDATGIGDQFPMQSSDLVKRAQEYFLDNYDRLAPKYRKELATNIVKQASEFGMFVEDEIIRKYAGQTFSRALQGNVMARKSILLEKNASDVLDQLYARRTLLGSEKFAEALEQFDKQSGISEYWGKDIKDPYLSTYEVTKVAQWTYRQGQDVINEQQLRKFVDNHLDSLHGYVNDYIIRDMKMMPVEIFDSLPRPEKEIIIAKMEEAGVA
jgi:hypothetical protein